MSTPGSDTVLPRAEDIDTRSRTVKPEARRRAGWSEVPTWLLVMPAILYLLVILALPLGDMVWTSVSDPVLGFGHYTEVLTDPIYLRVYLRTFLVAGGVTLLCLLLGYPLAHYIARQGGWVAGVMLTVTGLCFWISFLVRTYAWTVILGNRGPFSMAARWLGMDPPPVLLFTTWASLIAMTHILMPYMVLILYVALSRIDADLIRAANGLGASRAQTFFGVVLPLSMPGVISGSLLVFIFCIGFYVTPALLGSPRDMMIASLIANEIESLLDFGRAAALSMVLLGAVLVLLVIYDRLVGLDRIIR